MYKTYVTSVMIYTLKQERERISPNAKDNGSENFKILLHPWQHFVGLRNICEIRDVIRWTRIRRHEEIM